MRKTLAFLLPLVLCASLGQARPAETLDIYFIDTEGGQATLFVSPSGESALVDSGNRGGRDAGRIMAVVRDVGLTQIDFRAFIANVDDPATRARVLTEATPGTERGDPEYAPAYLIKVSARADGSFTVTNTRNGFRKTYAAR